jgi:protein SCO1/2
MQPRSNRWRWGLCAALVLAAAWHGSAVAGAETTEEPPRFEREVIDPSSIQIEDRLGVKVPLDLTFRDESGEAVSLASLVSGELPVILQLVYYQCPSLCNFTLNGFVDAAKQSRYRIGEDYEVITVSIDHKETHDLAAAKKSSYLGDLGQPAAGNGWRWLVGDAASIRKLADAVGFGYRFDPVQDEYAHGAALHVLTPGARLSRNLHGVQYAPKDFDLALLEASNGAIAKGVFERLALVCYRYDPQARGYVLSARQVMKLGGVVTLVLVGALLALLWRRERRRAAALRQEIPSTMERHS